MYVHTNTAVEDWRLQISSVASAFQLILTGRTGRQIGGLTCESPVAVGETDNVDAAAADDDDDDGSIWLLGGRIRQDSPHPQARLVTIYMHQRPQKVFQGEREWESGTAGVGIRRDGARIDQESDGSRLAHPVGCGGGGCCS